ncbi:MAG: hypothetical protein AAGD05_15960 [Bacteroidota bacterium]
MRLRRRAFSVLLIFCFALHSQAQWEKAVYAEVLGNGFIIASINYDQRIAHTRFGARLGFTIVDARAGQFTFPFMVNYLMGSDRHAIEVGIGGLYINKQIEFGSPFLSGTAFNGSLMYRLHFSKTNLLIRAGFATIHKSEKPLPFWPGFSFGTRF